MTYSWTFTMRDFGTERMMTVLLDGRIIGRLDPFCEIGVPATAAGRGRVLRRAAAVYVRAWLAQASSVPDEQ